MVDHRRPAGLFVRRLPRRDFLRYAALTGLSFPAVLAACGRETRPSAEGQGIGGRLDYFSWEGYDMQAAPEQWRRDHDVQLEAGYIGTADDIPARVLGPGGEGIDVTTYYYGHGRNWLGLGVLSEFDGAEVPSIEDLFPVFRESRFWQTDEGRYFGVPFTWLPWPLSYRADLVDRPTRWADLFEDEFAGKVAWVDDPVALITTAAIVLGLDPSRMTPSDLDQVKEWLLRLKRNTRIISPSYGDLLNTLVSGEAVAAFVGWQAFNVWGAEQGVEIDFVIPEDGYGISIDCYAVASTADNRPTALAWLDLMISPGTQRAVATELLTGVVTPNALDGLPADVAALYPYDELESFLSSAQLHEIPWEEGGGYVTYEDWLAMWKEVQAA